MMNQIHHGDCLDVLKTLADNSVDLIATDPPYFRVKGEAWDNQWASAAAFLDWIEALCVEWRRVLKPNGSLYVFASPQMSHGVEGVIRKHFNVLTNIRWQKPKFSTKAEMFRKQDLRAYFPASETVIFAEHFGADNMAKGEAGYAAKCDELRGFVFEPLRAYLDGERIAAGLDNKASDQITGNQMAGHYYTTSQWALPTANVYAKLQAGTGRFGQQYEQLRQQYEQLRRPFAVTADVPYTDVWTFATVGAYKGKHVCEKPAALMEHIITSSSRPGAVVLDCFMGSNATGKAARKLGRAYIGIELDPHWVAKARAATPLPPALPALVPVLMHVATRHRTQHRVYPQLDLFAQPQPVHLQPL